MEKHILSSVDTVEKYLTDNKIEFKVSILHEF